ncbi:unannotated protein [freshwater metagenome]|uniref:Unannotated protein n=1 Tax=freshwater metagenome TaxID=449393 RepID=A0A6J7IA62_9ZZZZ|nr:hypothetical protein [Actinomycetota bacterium]
MKVKKYVWSWFDGDGIYTNTDDSLEEIIEGVFEYYFDDDVEIVVKKTENQIEIEVTDHRNGLTKLHKIDNRCWSVADFLMLIASEEDRPDKFNIEEMC